jgi:lysophospholipase L1-like esterase
MTNCITFRDEMNAQRRNHPVKTRFLRLLGSALATGAACVCLAGCGSGDSALTNDNPGSNDLNVVVAFGDSITKGSDCPCVPYPSRLSGLIGKIVYNAGSGGSTAKSGVGRTQKVINQYHPAYMLILYGINDIIHSDNLEGILAALDQMVAICKQNNVVPVLATYPQLVDSHEIFAFGGLALNQGIRNLAKVDKIRCVDLEPEFNADLALYEDDGLHPNDAGTQIMTMAFADLF